MWQIVGRSRRGESFALDGLDVWTLDWDRQEERGTPIWDPVYRRSIEVEPYRISAGEKTVEFAAAEYDSGLWLFCRRSLPGCGC